MKNLSEEPKGHQTRHFYTNGNTSAFADCTGGSKSILWGVMVGDFFLNHEPPDWFHGFYPARVRKSLALKILVSAAD